VLIQRAPELFDILDPPLYLGSRYHACVLDLTLWRERAGPSMALALFDRDVGQGLHARSSCFAGALYFRNPGVPASPFKSF